ncbi:LapA family protein [Maribellus sediminis]|uniref:LapA family protein n=1 Tax=Maribellus sediminis TaxID=2696285 RepID=UPI0014309D4D|nr:LapA family protein [Maribellus sediminis]
MQAIVILLLILAVLLVIFTLQNQTDLTIQVFFWEIKEAPLVLVLLACILLGYILATIYFLPRIWKVKKDYKKLIRFNDELKKLHDLDHPEKPKDEIIDPEGMEFDDDDDDDSFFKD